MAILEATHTAQLDGAGSFSVSLPLTDSRAAAAQTGRIWQHFREGEGFAFAGLIENIAKTPEDKLAISGPTILGELLYKNTLLNRQYSAQTINAIIDALLALGSGWTRSGSNTTAISIRFDGDSVLKALLDTLGQQGLHLRENVSASGGALTKLLEIGAFGASSGVTIMNGHPDQELLDDPNLALCDALTIEETDEEVWNWIVPLGGGDGKGQLTLQYSTRTTPYTIQTVAGPDGATIYYLSDAGSITTYGQRERVLVAKDIAPLSFTKAALQAAANALYDVAVAQMGFWIAKQTAYTLSVRGLKPGVRPGDKVRLRWRGMARRFDESYVYLNVDTELWVLERTRRFTDDGSETSTLVVSDAARQLQSQTEVVIGKLEETTRSFRTRVQPGVSNWTSPAPFYQPLGTAKPAAFDLVVPDNVIQLLLCKLRLKPRAIRSTAAGAASGGGQTSSAEASHTHTLPTHSHSLSGVTTDSGGGATSGATGAHRHLVGNVIDLGGWSNPARGIAFYLYDSAGTVLGQVFQVGAGAAITADWYTKEQSADHTHTTPDHTHGFTGQTTAAGGGVTSNAGSSHGHSVADHTHTQTYGIYEGTTATALTISIDGVDRTAALGGPWSAAATIDITAYLLDADGVVVHGVHPISIGTGTLGAVEVWGEWVALVGALSLS